MSRSITYALLLLCFLIQPSVGQTYEGTFTGTNYVDLGYRMTDHRVRSISFSFVPLSTINGWGNDGYTFIGRNDSTENKEFGVFIRGTDWSMVGGVGTLCFYYRDNHVLHEIQSNQNTWTGGQCYYVAATLDSLQGMKLYINGVLQMQTDASGKGPVLQDTVYLTAIGCWGDYYQRHFIGDINNMALWNTALTPTEIQTTMNGVFSVTDPKLVALYKFDEGSGSTLVDASPNALNGACYNLIWNSEHKCDYTTGIKQVQMNSETYCYPNPTTGKIYFGPEQTEVEIYNSCGQLIQANRKEPQLVDITEQEAGLYFLRMENRTYKIIKLNSQ